MELPTTIFGATGRRVTRFGLGGEGVLRTHGRDGEARAVIASAVEHGVSYFDSARAYAGSEGYYGDFWRASPEARGRVFITSKSASRDASGARRDLAATLKHLAVDAIDLWQIHDVREPEEIDAIKRRGGALEAFLAAKDAGQVRHLGVTGHHDPAVLLRAVRELPVESVLLPVNVAEAALGGFLTDVLSAARDRGIGVVGMKALGQGTLLDAVPGATADSLLRFALAQPVDTVIVGCSTPAEVRANVASALAAPMDAAEQRDWTTRFRKNARSLAYYRGA